LFLDTGIRVSELCGIRLIDFDQKNSRIRVLGKGKKERFVYIGTTAGQAIWRYHLERFRDNPPKQDDFMFADYTNLYPMTRGSVLQLLQYIGEKADVPNCHPHRLRHTFAVEFLKNGGDVITLQELLGHSDLSMTRKYLNLAQSDIQAIHKRASPSDRIFKK